MAGDYLTANGLVGSDFVAIPVRGADWCTQSASSVVKQVIAIPVNSHQDEQGLKLAEWALTTREGFDLTNYGVQGQDYTLIGDRLKILNGPKTAPISGVLVWDDEMNRLSVNAPVNAADLADDNDTILLPYAAYPRILGLSESTQDSAHNPIAAIAADGGQLISDRENLLMGLMPTAEGEDAQPVTNASAALKLLHRLDKSGAATRLANAYGAVLLELTK